MNYRHLTMIDLKRFTPNQINELHVLIRNADSVSVDEQRIMRVYHTSIRRGRIFYASVPEAKYPPQISEPSIA
jgi:hypothetical protein